MGHPKRSNDWYIAPTSAGAARSQSDEIPGVPVRLPKSGSVEFIDWLDRVDWSTSSTITGTSNR